MSAVETKFGRQTVIPVSKIRENSEALRTQVDKESCEYVELVNAIRKNGFTSVITVREVTDPETDEIYYPLVDGLHRYTAACEVGLEELPVLILNMEETEVIAAQVMANATRVQTQPAQFAAALKKVLQLKPNLTKEELGATVGKSGAWVEGQLKLTKLTADIQKLVNEGQLVVSNAIALSGLPPDRQAEFLSEAMSQSPASFGPRITDVVKEIRAAARQGRVAVIEFKPVAVPRKTAQVKNVLEEIETGNPITIKSLIDSNGVNDPVEAGSLMVKWFLSMDPQSIAMQKAKWDSEQAQKKSDKEKREAERQAAKEAKAKETADKVAAKV